MILPGIVGRRAAMRAVPFRPEALASNRDQAVDRPRRTAPCHADKKRRDLAAREQQRPQARSVNVAFPGTKGDVARFGRLPANGCTDESAVASAWLAPRISHRSSSVSPWFCWGLRWLLVPSVPASPISLIVVAAGAIGASVARP